jgi:hypothetical protein
VRKKKSGGEMKTKDELEEKYGYEVAERAAILESEARMTREDAERLAVKMEEEQ